MSDALDAFLDEDPFQPLDEAREVAAPDYWVTDILTATKALGRVGRIDREINKIEDAANERLDQIRAWQNGECDRLMQRRSYYEALLAHYHASVLDEDPKAKTIKLSNGSLVARKAPDNIEIPDPDALMVWVRENDLDNHYIRIKTELNRSTLKEDVLKGGAIIPGVEIVPGEVKFNVSPN